MEIAWSYQSIDPYVKRRSSRRGTTAFWNRPLTASASGDPTGFYWRDATSPYADTFEIRREGDEYELQLDTYGQKLSDGTRTTGAIRGRFELSQNGCAGAYLAPEDECSIFILFTPGGANVHQFGGSLFGAGAWAGGAYRRSHTPGEQRGLRRHSGATPAASADVKF